MKDTLLLILFFLIILIIGITSLFILRAIVFLINNYEAINGVGFALIPGNFISLIKDIFPFAVILSIITLFVRIYKHPGIVWLSHILILAISASIWFGGFFYLNNQNSKTYNPSPAINLFPGHIHDFPEDRAYIHGINNDILHSSIIAGVGSNDSNLRYFDTIKSSEMKDTITGFDKRRNPTFYPIIQVSSLFSSTLDDLQKFKDDLHTLFIQNRKLFYILSISILIFFICSSILLKISKLPLFLVAVMLLLIRLFFFIFTKFSIGLPAIFIETILEKQVYPPLFPTVYLAALFLFITVRYYLLHPAKRSEAVK